MKRPTEADLVYLDSNVIIEICDGRLDELKSNISNAVRSGKVVYPFSSSQVSEIAAHPLTERCRARLNLLSSISKDIYFVHSVYEYEFRIQSPLAVYETITEVLPELNENRLFANMIPIEHFKAARQQLGLDPVRLNNLSGREAVAEIDRAISGAVSAGVKAPRSIREILEATKQITREHFSALWEQMGTTEAHMTIGNDLQSVFTLLECFGYWPDSEDVYKKGSRFPDAQHTFNASHFDILVTRDKGMKNRAQAAYAVLGVGTRVLLTSEYETYMLQG
jgi:hypothetical protein